MVAPAFKQTAKTRILTNAGIEQREAEAVVSKIAMAQKKATRQIEPEKVT